MTRHIESLPVDEFTSDGVQIVEHLPDGRVRLADGRVGRVGRRGGFAESGGNKMGVPGNTAAVTHGALSEQIVSARAQRVLADLQEACPWIIDVDGSVVDLMVRAKVRHDSYSRIIDEYGAETRFNEKGETGLEAVPERVLRQADISGKLLLDTLGQLGMTPKERAALMKDTSWARALTGRGGAGAVADRGRAIREARGRLPE